MSEKKNYLSKFLEETSQQSPSGKRRIYRNPTLARLHLEQEVNSRKMKHKLRRHLHFMILCNKKTVLEQMQSQMSSCPLKMLQNNTNKMELLENEDSFGDIIQNMLAQKLSFLYDKFKRIMSDHNQLFILVLRLKKIVMGTLQMNSSILLDDTLQTIIDKCVDCQECDRASCFIVDQSKRNYGQVQLTELQLQSVYRWGKNSWVCCTIKTILNIEDAYRDQRFNSQQDIKNNYKTKTLLVCPIMENEKCVGVLQCVNKQSGYFTKDDEALLQIMREFSRSVQKCDES